MAEGSERQADKTVKHGWAEQHKVPILVTLGWCLILLIIIAVAGGGGGNKNTQNTSQATASGSSTSSATSSNAAEQPPAQACTTYQAIDSQTWLEIVKDPDSYTDQCYVVYGDVTQFDSSTGTGGFRADVGGVQQTPSYGFVNYPTNTILVGDPTTLKDVVNQDLFTANVMVLGSYSYTTSLGGQLTVPQLQVDSITVTGSVSD